MPNCHFAQINIGRMLAPIDDPIMAEFVGLKPCLSLWKSAGSRLACASPHGFHVLSEWLQPSESRRRIMRSWRGRGMSLLKIGRVKDNEKEYVMKLLRFFMLVFAICMAQTACSGVKMSYSETTPIPNDIQIPSLVLHGNKYTFVVATEPNVTCYAAIGFWDKNDNWTFDELPSKKADGTAICKWEWEIPSNAKDGVGEFRGYVENDKQSTGFFPTNFCIERCP